MSRALSRAKSFTRSGRIISRRSAIITALGFAMAPRVVRAQNAATFPDHPVRIIVSTAAGGGVDAFARIVTAKMSADLGQAFPVENAPALAAASGPMRSSIPPRTATRCSPRNRRRSPPTDSS